MPSAIINPNIEPLGSEKEQKQNDVKQFFSAPEDDTREQPWKNIISVTKNETYTCELLVYGVLWNILWKISR